jgi:leader peptidase (prepilin peptidase)/N-methyltransferase
MLDIAGGIVLGLLVGSFLNVVIYRLPVMLEREWREQCQDLLAAAGTAPPNDKQGEDPNEHPNENPSENPNEDSEPFNLVQPRSRCPECGAQVKAWQNMPVISWLLLRGKCASCNTAISARYPAIEILTGLLSGLVAWRFGITLEAAGILLLVWALIALTVIDIDHQLLPDNITVPLLWAGIVFSMVHTPAIDLPFPDLQSSVIGAIAGYLSLWSVYWLFKLLTGKEGMGYGDFKLLAALGAWLGWQMLPLIIMLSAVVGAVTGVAMILLLGRDRQIPIPFGPYLAGAGLIALFWGQEMSDAYLSYSGI